MPAATVGKNGLGKRGKLAILLAALVVAAELAFFLGWILVESNPPGREIKVAVETHDPRDFLRGQYVELDFRFEDRRAYASGPELIPAGQEVWVALARQPGKDLYQALACDASSAGLAARVATAGFRNGDWVEVKGRVIRDNFFDFGINRFFVPEGTLEPSRLDLVAVLGVTEDGELRLRRLENAGVAWEPVPAKF
ncbi:MAG: GDYXXLXY domain-containing protein [Planctomycetota bacterium]|jgi:uncharacterized membrane-anchored protein|nr:GDYXXLXY domain-containing protein [Planctomycetota bacterium]